MFFFFKEPISTNPPTNDELDEDPERRLLVLSGGDWNASLTCSVIQTTPFFTRAEPLWPTGM